MIGIDAIVWFVFVVIVVVGILALLWFTIGYAETKLPMPMAWNIVLMHLIGFPLVRFDGGRP